MVNAYVEKSGDVVRQINWGDDINYHFIKYIAKRNIEIYFDNSLAMALKRPNYLCIGSTINYLTTRQTVIWGAGVIDPRLSIREEPAQVRAVRGPLSRDYLLSRGVSCPDVYGDPALLIPYFYKPTSAKARKPGRIAIVPHYVDQDSPILREVCLRYSEVTVIDIVKYGRWTDFIDKISEFDVVFSSSLHGLIAAEAYGIPNYWISLSDKVVGDGFKFRDYFASIGKSDVEPIVLDANSNPSILASSSPWNPGRIDLKRLLAECPFEIKMAIQYEHPLDL